MAQMTALRRRMIDDMTVRNLSPATQQSYVYAVANQILAAVTRDHLGIAVAAGDFVFAHPIPNRRAGKCTRCTVQ